MNKPRLTGMRAIWLGLIGTPLVLVAVLAVVGVAVSSAGSSSLQAGKASSEQVAVNKDATATAAAVQAYWTPERMKDAQPMVKVLSSSTGKATVAGDSATGTPGFAGGRHANGAAIAAPNTPSGATTSTGVVPADGGYPGPYTGFKWYPKYRTPPVSTIAKIFFTQDVNGNNTPGNFVCSGSVTYGGSLDTVWTAGHCVNNGLNGAGTNNGFSYNVLVCPSYINGINAAVGCWAYTGELVSVFWYTNGSLSRDMGGITTAATGTVISDHIANVTGALGFAWNWGRDQSWFDFGYPALPNPPFNGGAINTCASEHRYDVNTDGDGPDTNSIGCNSGRGSSGGPWILFFSGDGGFINSVNSWLYLAQEGAEIQGPYYDTYSCQVWKALTGYGPSC